jgi:uncharacterized protein (TIGR02996 family)
MTWPPRSGAPTDPQVRAFLDDIADNPDDAGVRLVFADWLQENGDPRSEILRMQAAYLRREDRAGIDRCVEAWLGTHGRTWLGELTIEPNSGFCLRLQSGLLAVGSQAPLLPLLLSDPKLEGLRQALREGWVRFFRMTRWSHHDIVRAAELGLLSGPAELDWLTGLFTEDSLACLAWSASTCSIASGSRVRALPTCTD